MNGYRFFYHYFAHYSITKYNLPVGYDYDATANDVFEIFLKRSCEHLRNNSLDLENFIKEFLDEIENFTSSFKIIIEKVKEDCKFKKLFSFLGLNTMVYPLIISLELKDWLDNSMINIIETLDLRVYKVRGTDPRAKLYREVISQIKITTNPEEIKTGIISFINEFMPNPLFQHYLNQSIYDNPATKFILWEYEKYKDSTSNDCNYQLYMDCQKEHIFAQNPKPTFPSYGFSNEEEYFANINKLGNLCLLETKLNKQIQNKLINQKKQYYQQSKIKRTKQLGFDIDNKGFNKSEIDKITQKIIDFCLARWRV